MPKVIRPDRTRAKDDAVVTIAVGEADQLSIRIPTLGMPKALSDAMRAIARGDARSAGVRIQQAISQVERSQPDPDLSAAIGAVLAKLGMPRQACQWYQKAIDLRPEPTVYALMAELLVKAGKIWDAICLIRKAIQIAPDLYRLHSILANYLIAAGSVQDGLSVLRFLAKASPSRQVHSSLLWHLHHVEQIDCQVLAAEHRAWADLYADVSMARKAHENDPDPDRRLRIGYISPDFYNHSVAYFFESLLDGHDRQQVEVIGYGNVDCQDDVTDRLKVKFDLYRNIKGIPDQAVARMIMDDRIDILVDLAGHTNSNRLMVLARKPAPIQVSFLGYPDTTGMRQVDYRFTDQWADLPGAEGYYTEQLVFIPSGFICYRPPKFAPPVGPLPALRNGFVTFCSFNNNQKINNKVLDMWAAVLRNLPNSRLLLKFKCGNDPAARGHYLNEFAARGVDRSRICLSGWLKQSDHLNLYNLADIALDTFPYHGTTTTCEALWMGVPTISLIGEHHVSRVGLSILSRVGLEEFAASTAREYVAKAVVFARQTEQLAALRKVLRKMVIASSLCDYKAYARDIEAAYRQMWQRWCKRQTEPIAAVQSA